MGLANGDKIRASIFSSIFGQRIILTRVYDFIGAGLPGQTVPEALFEAGKLLFDNGANDVLDKYIACMPTNLSIDFWRMQVIKPTRSVLVDEVVAGTGGYGDVATTANTAGTITFRTDFAGRNQVSTVHVGPLPVNAFDNGALNNLYRTALAGLGDVLDQGIDGALFIGGILAPIILHPDGTKDNIFSHVVGTKVRTMRRRTVGYGE